MKRALHLFLVLGLLLTVLPASAQIDTTSCRVRNYKFHALMHDGPNMNVLDVDIDWPDSIDGNHCQPLRQYLSRTMGTTAVTADSVIMELAEGCGQPVRKQLDTIPDDRRFCYATYSVGLRAYKPATYVVFDVKYSVEPASLSGMKATSASHVVTYDLRKDQLFEDVSLLQINLIRNGYASADFFNKLFAPLDDDTFNDLQWANIEAAWPDGDRLFMRMHCLTSDRNITYDVALDYNDAATYVTRKGRKVIEGKLNVR